MWSENKAQRMRVGENSKAWPGGEVRGRGGYSLRTRWGSYVSCCSPQKRDCSSIRVNLRDASPPEGKGPLWDRILISGSFQGYILRPIGRKCFKRCSSIRKKVSSNDHRCPSQLNDKIQPRRQGHRQYFHKLICGGDLSLITDLD